jgi:hypothetical protein
MPDSLQRDPAIQLSSLSERFELSGAAILNIIHFASLKAFARGDGVIRADDVLEGIKREYRKEEKTIRI